MHVLIVLYCFLLYMYLSWAGRNDSNSRYIYLLASYAWQWYSLLTGLRTIQPDYKPVGPFSTGWGYAKSESWSTSWHEQSEIVPMRALDGLVPRSQRQLDQSPPCGVWEWSKDFNWQQLFVLCPEWVLLAPQYTACTDVLNLGTSDVLVVPSTDECSWKTTVRGYNGFLVDEL